MLNKELPVLGSIVNYVRVDSENEIHVGKGIVRSLHLSPDDRLMVQVKDNEDNAWNIDLFCVNASSRDVELYGRMIKNVNLISSEGNELIKGMVTDYNERVEGGYSTVLGEPVECESL